MLLLSAEVVRFSKSRSCIWQEFRPEQGGSAGLPRAAARDSKVVVGKQDLVGVGEEGWADGTKTEQGARQLTVCPEL